MNHWNKKNLRQFIAGMVGYSLLLPLSMIVNDKINLSLTSKMLLVLLPMIPILLAMNALINNYRDMDEYWRKVFMESLLLTAAITAFSSFSLGLLQANGFIPNFPYLFVLPYMISIWGLCLFFVNKKYQS